MYEKGFYFPQQSENTNKVVIGKTGKGKAFRGSFYSVDAMIQQIKEQLQKSDRGGMGFHSLSMKLQSLETMKAKGQNMYYLIDPAAELEG